MLRMTVHLFPDCTSTPSLSIHDIYLELHLHLLWILSSEGNLPSPVPRRSLGTCKHNTAVHYRRP